MYLDIPTIRDIIAQEMDERESLLYVDEQDDKAIIHVGDEDSQMGYKITVEVEP